MASSWHPGPVPPVEAAVEARRPRPTGRTQARPGDPTMARAWGRGQDQTRVQVPTGRTGVLAGGGDGKAGGQEPGRAPTMPDHSTVGL